MGCTRRIVRGRKGINAVYFSENADAEQRISSRDAGYQ